MIIFKKFKDIRKFHQNTSFYTVGRKIKNLKLYNLFYIRKVINKEPNVVVFAQKHTADLLSRKHI